MVPKPLALLSEQVAHVQCAGQGVDEGPRKTTEVDLFSSQSQLVASFVFVF